MQSIKAVAVLVVFAVGRLRLSMGGQVTHVGGSHFDDCPVGTSVEQVSGLTVRYAQRTAGAHDALVVIALALAGRAGSRLAAALGMPVSRSTLLRRTRSLPEPVVGLVTVLNHGRIRVATRP